MVRNLENNTNIRSPDDDDDDGKASAKMLVGDNSFHGNDIYSYATCMKYEWDQLEEEGQVPDLSILEKTWPTDIPEKSDFTKDKWTKNNVDRKDFKLNDNKTTPDKIKKEVEILKEDPGQDQPSKTEEILFDPKQPSSAPYSHASYEKGPVACRSGLSEFLDNRITYKEKIHLKEKLFGVQGKPGPMEDYGQIGSSTGRIAFPEMNDTSRRSILSIGTSEPSMKDMENEVNMTSSHGDGNEAHNRMDSNISEDPAYIRHQLQERKERLYRTVCIPEKATTDVEEVEKGQAEIEMEERDVKNSQEDEKMQKNTPRSNDGDIGDIINTEISENAENELPDNDKASFDNKNGIEDQLEKILEEEVMEKEKKDSDDSDKDKDDNEKSRDEETEKTDGQTETELICENNNLKKEIYGCWKGIQQEALELEKLMLCILGQKGENLVNFLHYELPGYIEQFGNAATKEEKTTQFEVMIRNFQNKASEIMVTKKEDILKLEEEAEIEKAMLETEKDAFICKNEDENKDNKIVSKKRHRRKRKNGKDKTSEVDSEIENSQKPAQVNKSKKKLKKQGKKRRRCRFLHKGRGKSGRQAAKINRGSSKSASQPQTGSGTAKQGACQSQNGSTHRGSCSASGNDEDDGDGDKEQRKRPDKKNEPDDKMDGGDSEENADEGAEQSSMPMQACRRKVAKTAVLPNTVCSIGSSKQPYSSLPSTPMLAHNEQNSSLMTFDLKQTFHWSSNSLWLLCECELCVFAKVKLKHIVTCQLRMSTLCGHCNQVSISFQAVIKHCGDEGDCKQCLIPFCDQLKPVLPQTHAENTIWMRCLLRCVSEYIKSLFGAHSINPPGRQMMANRILTQNPGVPGEIQSMPFYGTLDEPPPCAPSRGVPMLMVGGRPGLHSRQPGTQHGFEVYVRRTTQSPSVSRDVPHLESMANSTAQFQVGGGPFASLPPTTSHRHLQGLRRDQWPPAQSFNSNTNGVDSTDCVIDGDDTTTTNSTNQDGCQDIMARGAAASSQPSPPRRHSRVQPHPQQSPQEAFLHDRVGTTGQRLAPLEEIEEELAADGIVRGTAANEVVPAVQHTVEQQAGTPSSQLTSIQLIGTVNQMPSFIVKHVRVLSQHWKELARRVQGGKILDNTEEGILTHPGLRCVNSHYTVNEHWSMHNVVGTGKYGNCRIVSDNTTHFICAVKESHLRDFVNNSDEAIIWCKLAHPNIPKLYGILRIGDKVYYFMEYIRGCNIRQVLENPENNLPTIPEDVANHWAYQVMGALLYLHKKRVVHGDIKAANVVVTEDGERAYLVDLGFSRQLSQGQTHFPARENPQGTPAYMAPEIAGSDVHGTEADIWAWVCFILHMLNGHAPWTSQYRDAIQLYYAITTKDAPTREIPSTCSEPTRRLIEWGLEKQAARRPTAMQCYYHEAFKGAVSSDTIQSLPEPEVTGNRRWSMTVPALPEYRSLPSSQPVDDSTSNVTRSWIPADVQTAAVPSECTNQSGRQQGEVTSAATHGYDVAANSHDVAANSHVAAVNSHDVEIVSSKSSGTTTPTPEILVASTQLASSPADSRVAASNTVSVHGDEGDDDDIYSPDPRFLQNPGENGNPKLGDCLAENTLLGSSGTIIGSDSSAKTPLNSGSNTDAGNVKVHETAEEISDLTSPEVEEEKPIMVPKPVLIATPRYRDSQLAVEHKIVDVYMASAGEPLFSALEHPVTAGEGEQIKQQDEDVDRKHGTGDEDNDDKKHSDSHEGEDGQSDSATGGASKASGDMERPVVELRPSTRRCVLAPRFDEPLEPPKTNKSVRAPKRSKSETPASSMSTTPVPHSHSSSSLDRVSRQQSQPNMMRTLSMASAHSVSSEEVLAEYESLKTEQCQLFLAEGGLEKSPEEQMELMTSFLDLEEPQNTSATNTSFDFTQHHSKENIAESYYLYQLPETSQGGSSSNSSGVGTYSTVGASPTLDSKLAELRRELSEDNNQMTPGTRVDVYLADCDSHLCTIRLPATQTTRNIAKGISQKVFEESLMTAFSLVSMDGQSVPLYQEIGDNSLKVRVVQVNGDDWTWRVTDKNGIEKKGEEQYYDTTFQPFFE
ncbi:uncharacterized protein LOC144434617 isoform X3 [Glandiceps talaboti]